jgi:flavin-dependent dehydrogenase
MDVAVVGGGPAGAVIAMLLARAGHTVVVVDRSTRNRPSMGETLPPVANALLNRLGLANRFSKERHLPVEGLVSIWGGSAPYVNDFFVSAQGLGWNLNRTQFDAMLLDEAEKAGAQICRNASLVSCERLGNGKWSLRIQNKESPPWLLARFLVDASGRTGANAISFLSQRVFTDRLIGVAKFYACETKSRYTLIEATDEGWFYSLDTTDGYLVIYFSDADIHSLGRKTREDYWKGEIRKAKHTEERVGDAAPLGVARIITAATSKRIYVTGPGWISIGDAAMSFDPLSSLGIYKAVDSGIRACQSVLGALRQSATCKGYADWSNHTFNTYMIQRAEIYKKQSRWKGSEFWKRRRGF